MPNESFEKYVSNHKSKGNSFWKHIKIGEKPKATSSPVLKTSRTMAKKQKGIS